MASESPALDPRAQILDLVRTHVSLPARQIVAALVSQGASKTAAHNALELAALAGEIVLTSRPGAPKTASLPPTAEQLVAAGQKAAEEKLEAEAALAVQAAEKDALAADLAARTAPGWSPAHEPRPRPGAQAECASMSIGEIPASQDEQGALDEPHWHAIVTMLATQPDLVQTPAGPAWLRGDYLLVPATDVDLRRRVVTVAAEKMSARYLAAITSALRAQRDLTPVSPINMIASGPLFSERGALIATPGYHRDPGILVRPYTGHEDLTDGALRARLAEHAGDHLALARECAAHLLQTIKTIPTDAAGFCAWLVHVMTLLTRDQFPCAPAFVYNATRPGSGKTISARAAMIIGAGGIFAELPFSTQTGAELAKSLGAEFAQTSGGGAIPRAVLIDNANLQEFRDPVLENWLTSPTISGRELGVSKNFRAPNRLTLAITVNGGSFAADMNRRSVSIELASTSDNPSALVFNSPPPDVYARLHASDLAREAITMLWAHREAGAPQPPCAPLNSFEAWWRAAGAPVLWATGVNPLEATQRRIVADDPDLERRALWIALLEAVGAVDGKALPMAEILRLGSRKNRATLDAALDCLPLRAETRREHSAAVIGKHITRTLANAWVRLEGGMKMIRTTKNTHTKATEYSVAVQQ